MTGRRRIWPLLLASAIGLAILLSLGVWQVKRLAWKEGLIARLEANAAAEPVDLASAEKLRLEGANIEFLKVRFKATYVAGAELAMISTFGGGPGWTIITPAISAAGDGVLVDRGQVPPDRLGKVAPPAGEVEITGIVRLHTSGKGYFDPDNDPAKNAWYWWDVPAMLKASGFPPENRPLPFVVQILPGTVAADYPKPPEPKSDLRNNHLGYANTWFGLAAVLVVMTGLYIRSLLKKSSA